jgi:hypothetical protein
MCSDPICTFPNAYTHPLHLCSSHTRATPRRPAHPHRRPTIPLLKYAPIRPSSTTSPRPPTATSMHARLIAVWRSGRRCRAVVAVVAGRAVRRAAGGGPGVEAEEGGEVESDEGGDGGEDWGSGLGLVGGLDARGADWELGVRFRLHACGWRDVSSFTLATATVQVEGRTRSSERASCLLRLCRAGVRLSSLPGAVRDLCGR